MDLKLPHLGEGADSGTVVNLLVKEGDLITKDQPILELENEKAVATIPSTAAGTVAQIFVKVGAGAPAKPRTIHPDAFTTADAGRRRRRHSGASLRGKGGPGARRCPIHSQTGTRFGH
jgi:hypothetical protein